MNKINRHIRRLLAGISAALLILSFPPFSMWPLAWIAFCPLFLAALDCPDAKSAANLGGFTGLLFYGISLHWLLKIFGPVALAFWCVFALWLALHITLLWKIWNNELLGNAVRLKRILFVAAAGLLWTGIEYFRCEIWWLECSWLALGYSQTPAASLFQTCGLLGIYGLSALIVSVNAALFLSLKERRAAPAISAVLFLSILSLWGGRRTHAFPAEQGRKISVALVQDESYNLDRLSALSLGEETKNADLLIWPEYSFPIQPGQDEIYLNLLRKKLKGSRSTAIIGAAVFHDEFKKNRMKNFAWIISPEGKLLGRYDKLHPIPYVEKRLQPGNRNLIPNPSPEPIPTPAGILGMQICYDLDFENGSRKMANLGAQIITVNNLDPVSWGKWQHFQHSNMSPARAVETGLWLVRSASSGYSQIIDPLGRIRSSMPMESSGVLTGTAYLLVAGTFYSKHGWVFAPLCCLLTLLALIACSGLFRVRD
ncbi:MAG: apolipoprotein N-acyltransferase [Elusimicrobia bacterium RIFOXYA12_FULL_51_18]|nr:MAG: apolipoprotein N-acyltransferase [Elusimicrobia bacterium RIFOXYA12_FULL_51_18]OGS30038.1 MAG: apolipoprotein N-acyltransferase [Elusimicrobia bacterium RIFOXYA2_FULL_53_38]